MSKQSPKIPGEAQPETVQDETVTVSAALLAELKAKVDRIEAQNKPRINLKDDRSALPNAADIDVSALKHAVLTKEGWICPLKQSNPNTLR
jgi:hypothetical protein